MIAKSIGGKRRGKNMNQLEWLMSWYLSNCNDDWEHRHGIKIDTLDNPGWTIRIDLMGTPLADREFARVDHDIAKADYDLANEVSWWSCRVENHQFHAACGAKDLASVLEIFRAWVSNPGAPAEFKQRR